MDLQGILCIANSSYAIKTPKDEVTYNTYWNFYKKLKIGTCFPQNGRFRDRTVGRETISQNGSLLFKVGGLEHILFGLLMFHKYSVAILVSVFLLRPFSVKMSIKKHISLWRYFSVHMVYAHEKKTFEYSHCDMRCYVWVWFYLFICYWCFPKDFEIMRVIINVSNGYIKETELLVFIFKFNRALYRWILTVQNV